MTVEGSTVFCSNHSLAVGEALFGTATRAQTVLLLEYNGRWEPDILEVDGLPDEVLARLKMLHKTLPDMKIWFIRRGKEDKGQQTARSGIALFVALVREQNPALYEFSLAAYEDLLALEFPALLAESSAYAGQRRTEPLVLVCTHGRRDRCCARLGRPVAEQLEAQLGAAVWQSSHVGGHRLAANVVALPHGLYYGRVGQLGPDLAPFAESLRAGQITLDAYRGHVCYAPPVQAAEYFLRRALGLTAWDALRLVDTDRTADQRWQIAFEQTANGTQHSVTLRAEVSDFRSYMNCDDVEPEVVTQYALDDIATRPAP